MEPFLGFLKNWLRPVKHALFRSTTLYWLRWQRLTTNRDALPIRRIAANTRKYLSRTLAPRELARSWVAIDSAQPFVPPPSKTLGKNRLTAYSHSTYREMFVVHLENVRVFGEVGHILTGDGTLLADLSFKNPATCYADNFSADLLRPHEQEQQLSGNTCLLASKWAGGNYFHYLFELLPRCEMIRRSGIELDSIDHFIVSPLQSDVYWEALDEFGIARDRVRFCESSSAFNVRHLIAPSTLLGTGHMRKWLCEWLNQTFAPSTSSRTRPVRLYVGRDDANTRRVTNQAEIVERVLLPLGFESVTWDGRSIREQAALFANAEVVVGVNGAALTNLVFCKPGTRVIVLHHPIHLSRLFFELSHTIGLEYYDLTGETTTLADFTSDYLVSRESLTALLNFADVK